MSISLHPNQKGGRSNLPETNEIGMFRYLDTVTKTQGAEKSGKAFEQLWFSLKGICTDTPWLDCTGRDRSRRFCSEMVGRKKQLGMLVCVSSARSVPVCVRGRHRKWMEDAQFGSPCGKDRRNALVWRNLPSFGIKFTLRGTQRE